MNNIAYKGEQCIIAMLLQYEIFFKQMRNELMKVQTLTNELQVNAEEVNLQIKNAYDSLMVEIRMKIFDMGNYLKERKKELESTALEYKMEIELLTEENKEMLEQINQLETQIRKMQCNIGPIA